MPAFTAHKTYTSGSASASVRIKATYTVTNNATQTIVKITELEAAYDGTTGSGAALNNAKNARTNALAQGIAYSIQCNSATLYSGTVKTVNGTIVYSRTGSGTTTIAKGTSATTKSLTMTLGGTAANPQTISVPALASYAVTYNANGGSGAPASQTKYYNQTLTLSSTKPTRTDYSFLGWSTSATATAAQYAAGASYTTNAALALYAVWKRIYQVPQLTVTQVYRSDSAGNQENEGTYAAVTVNWSIFDTASAGNGSNAVSSLTASCNGNSASASPSGLSGTQTFIINAGLGSGSYDLTVTLTDTKGGSSRAQSKTVKVPSAFYPMDILAGGHGIAFGAPATRQDVFEIGYKDTVFALNTNEDLYTGLSNLGWYSSILHSSGGIPSLKKLFTKMLGCCYSSGSSGGWTWRKYADGTLDLWVTSSGTSSPYSGTVNGWYPHRFSLSFPANAKPNNGDYSVWQELEIGTGFTMAGPVFNKSATGCMVYALAGAQGSLSYTARFYIHGTWK